MSVHKATFVWVFFLIFSGFLGFGKNSSASTSDLFISEVAVGIENSKNEFVEIKNGSGEKIDLKEYGLKLKLVSSSGKSTTKEIEWNNAKIVPDGFFLFGTGSMKVPFDATYSSASLTGKGGVIIADKNNTVIDEVFWTDLETDESLERINYIDEDSADDWQKSYISGGTPGEKNSEKPKPRSYSDKIFINEFLPAPASNEEEYIELFNPTTDDIDISGYLLKDASKTGKYVFPDGTEIKSLDYLVVNKKDFKFALNNSGAESVTLFTPDEKIISVVSYAGSKPEVSYNFDGKTWHWSRFLTPDEKNKFNNLPNVSKKKDNKIYVDVYADFSAKGHDKDKDKLKYVWDFGDGHKSYKKETRHKFKKAGKYKVTLKVSDGSEDKIEIFNIKVEKFPKSKVKIISVSPNPKGKDSDNEYIILQNKSKKEINLKGWSVATGSKKLYNHPILEDVIIEPGKTLTLTREFSKFSLNNKKAEVELRYPDGKVAHDFTYNKKLGGVKEDEIYTKESGQWAWIAPKTETQLAVTEKSVPTEIQPQMELGSLASKSDTDLSEIILADGQNFSQDENLRKKSIDNFTQPQGIVLGAVTFKPNIYNTYSIQSKSSPLESIFSRLNSLANYLLNKFFLKLHL